MKRNFSFHDLRIFHTVISEGGTRQASRSLHLSQPAISHAIARIEQASGAALFDRQKQSLRPTAAGLYLFEESSRILDDITRIDEELHTIEQFGARSLRVTMTPGLAWDFSSNLVRQYGAENGRRPLILDMSSSVQAVSAVETGLTDIALGAFRKDSPGLMCIPFARSYVMAVLHKQHVLAGAEIVRLNEIEPATFIKPLWSDYIVAEGEHYQRINGWSGMQAHMSLLPGMINETKGLSLISALTAFDLINVYPDLVAIPIDIRQWFTFYLTMRKPGLQADLHERLLNALHNVLEERKIGVFRNTLTAPDAHEDAQQQSAAPRENAATHKQ